MSFPQFLLRTLIVAIVMFGLGYVGHQLILGPDYKAIEPIMRSKSEMMAHMPFALLNAVVFSGAFVWIYSRVARKRSWLVEGVSFGIAVWAIAMVPLYVTNYVIEPWPGIFVAKILAWELVDVTILGLLIAALARSDKSA